VERGRAVLVRAVEVPDGLAKNLLTRVVSEDPGEGVVAVEENAVKRGPVDPGQVALEEIPVAQLRLVRCPASLPLAGDVRRHSDRADNVSGLPEPGGVLDFEDVLGHLDRK